MANEVKTLDPAVAWALLQDQPRAVLIDVRSSMEYLFVGHPQGSARKYFDATLTGAASEIYDLIASTVPEIGPRILGERFGLMWEMVIHSLADRERYLHDAQSGIGAGDAFINNLIDMVTGGLTAPVSPETSATT